MTTIVLVRKKNEVVVAGDGQVSMGNTVVKSSQWWEKETTEKPTVKTKPTVSTKRTQVGKKV